FRPLPRRRRAPPRSASTTRPDRGATHGGSGPGRPGPTRPDPRSRTVAGHSLIRLLRPSRAACTVRHGGTAPTSVPASAVVSAPAAHLRRHRIPDPPATRADPFGLGWLGV